MSGQAAGSPGLPRRPDLPEAIARYVERALPSHERVPRIVRIAQEGEMRQKPGGRALRFTAVQRIAVDRVAFSWRARFPILGPLALRVLDGYGDARGMLELRVLGLPLKRQTGPEVTGGEALRYLAELPWAPHAIAHNRELEWRELDRRRVEVATRVGGERLAVEVELDDSGDIVRCSSRMRLLEVDGAWVRTPWAGEFASYEWLGGTRIPTRAEVSWELESGRFVYWRGRITSAEPEF